MRYGLIGSIILHIVIFGFVIFSFMSRKDDSAAPPVPVSVEIMSPKDYSERQAGKTDGKAQTPAPPAEVKAPEATASAKKEVAEQTPTPKPAEKEALAPPPPAPAPAPAPAPKPVEQAKAEPKPEKPAEKAAPKKVVKKEAAPKPKPKPEARPEYKFDPSKIAADLNKEEDEPSRAAAQSTMEARPSKIYSDRQTALLNRDPNAGARAGDYDPSQPWRPASSLQEQAMGLPNAQGAMNAGTCADFIQSRVEQAFILPIGGLSAESTTIHLHMELKRDGTLMRPPAVQDQVYTPVQQAMADALLRAAESAQPYNIPPQQYEQCRDITLKFNPREMYGG